MSLEKSELMKARWYIVLCCLVLSIALAHGQSQGLYFVSHEEIQNKRTGMDLFSTQALPVKHELAMEFDVRFKPNQDSYYGYIFRAILNGGINIDLISRDYSPINKKVSLVVGDREFELELPKEGTYGYDWMPVKLHISLHDHTLTLQVADVEIDATPALPTPLKAKISFGVNKLDGFSTTDVPPIAVRELRIQADQVSYHWPLDQEDGTASVDNIQQSTARITNPIWGKSMHKHWMLALSVQTTTAASICFDSKREILYVVGDDQLMQFDVSSEEVHTVNYADGPLGLLQGNQSLYVPLTDRVYNIFPDQQLLTVFDTASRTWSKHYTPGETTAYWHFNKGYLPADSSIYVLGGYGYFNYKSDLFKVSLRDGRFERVELRHSDYTPRYLGGMAVSGDGVYLMGGYGSKTGRQEVNPHYYHDFLYLDPKGKTIHKLHDLPGAGRDYVVGNSMVIDSANGTYYALIHDKNRFDTHIKLRRGYLDGASASVLADSIPYRFSDIRSFSDLYWSVRNEKLLAVTLFDSGDKTEVKVYTVNFPPAHLDTQATANQGGMGYRFVLWVGLALAVLGVGGFFIVKRPKARLSTGNKPPSQVAALNDSVDQVNQLFFFGNFQAFDRKGEDITKKFTPILRNLLMIIGLHSIASKRGVSADRLYEAFWDDKSLKSARNNLLVNMGKLKLLIGELDGLQVSKDSGYWELSCDPGLVYFDYQHFMQLDRSRTTTVVDKMSAFADIVSRGAFLEDVNAEWADEYKSTVSALISETYMTYLALDDGVRGTDEQQLAIAHKVAHFSPMNEEAMTARCMLLAGQGMHQEAKLIYERFTTEYLKLYGEDFPKPLNSIQKR